MPKSDGLKSSTVTKALPPPIPPANTNAKRASIVKTNSAAAKAPPPPIPPANTNAKRASIVKTNSAAAKAPPPPIPPANTNVKRASIVKRNSAVAKSPPPPIPPAKTNTKRASIVKKPAKSKPPAMSQEVQPFVQNQEKLSSNSSLDDFERKLAEIEQKGSDITDAPAKPTSQSPKALNLDAFESKLNDLDDVIDENVEDIEYDDDAYKQVSLNASLSPFVESEPIPTDSLNLSLEEKLALAEKEKQNLINALEAVVGPDRLKQIVKAASPDKGLIGRPTSIRTSNESPRAIDVKWKARQARTIAEQKRRMRKNISIQHKKVHHQNRWGGGAVHKAPKRVTHKTIKSLVKRNQKSPNKVLADNLSLSLYNALENAKINEKESKKRIQKIQQWASELVKMTGESPRKLIKMLDQFDKQMTPPQKRDKFNRVIGKQKSARRYRSRIDEYASAHIYESQRKAGGRIGRNTVRHTTKNGIYGGMRSRFSPTTRGRGLQQAKRQRNEYNRVKNRGRNAFSVAPTLNHIIKYDLNSLPAGGD